MSPMLKALLAVKERGYNPPGPAPMERLALMSAAEAKMLKRLTDGRSSRTPFGIPSFADGGAGTSANTRSRNAGGTQSGVRQSSAPNSSASRANNSPSNAGGTQSGVRQSSAPQSASRPGNVGGSGGISTPRASGSPVNNPTGISNSSSRVERYSPPAAVNRVGISTPFASGSPNNNPVRAATLANEAMRRYYSNPANQVRPAAPSIAPGSNEAAYLANQYRPYLNPNTFTDDEPEQRAPIPIPRQNPLSDPSRFTYDRGRPRDYVFSGDDGLGQTDQSAVSRLVAMQERYGSPFRLTSGFRNPALNQRVDGAERSQHLQGNAFDVHTDDTSRENYTRLAQAAAQSGFTGFGAYRPGSLHVDTGPGRVWSPNRSNRLQVQAAINDPNIRQASGDQPRRRTVASLVAPIVKKSVGAVRNFVNPPDIPIPRPKPRVPSIVAPATGPPIPQMKPRIPSTVARATSIPTPRPNPMRSTQASITPAGGSPPSQQQQPSLWQQYAPQVAQDAATSVSESLAPVQELVTKYGPERAEQIIRMVAGNMSGKGKRRPTGGGGGVAKPWLYPEGIRMGNDKAYA